MHLQDMMRPGTYPKNARSAIEVVTTWDSRIETWKFVLSHPPNEFGGYKTFKPIEMG